MKYHFLNLRNLLFVTVQSWLLCQKHPNLKVIELDEGKAQLSLLIVRCRYMSLLSKLQLSVHDKEAALVLDNENVD
jgi:hypothetical protein